MAELCNVVHITSQAVDLWVSCQCTAHTCCVCQYSTEATHDGVPRRNDDHTHRGLGAAFSGRGKEGTPGVGGSSMTCLSLCRAPPGQGVEVASTTKHPRVEKDASCVSRDAARFCSNYLHSLSKIVVSINRGDTVPLSESVAACLFPIVQSMRTLQAGNYRNSRKVHE